MCSRTKRLCRCGWLDRMAENPDIPIQFDPLMNEYHFVIPVDGKPAGNLFLQHRRNCGGKAPESKRGSLFARLSRDEHARLVALVDPLKSLGAVVQALGEPKHDNPNGESISMPQADGNIATEPFRSLTYENLSDTATVYIAVYPDGPVARYRFMGKYIGPPRPPQG